MTIKPTGEDRGVIELLVKLQLPFRADTSSPQISAPRSRQRQSVFQLHDLFDAIGVHNLKARQCGSPVVQVDFARLADHVIEAVKRDIHHIVARIVTDAKERQPFCLRLVAQIERGDLDLCYLNLQQFEEDIKKRTPFRLLS